MARRTCARCGVQLADGVKFCGSCGAPTRAHVRARQAESVQRSRHDRRVIGAIACVYAGALLGLVLLWWMLGNEDGEVPDSGYWLLLGMDLVVGSAAIGLLGRGALRASLGGLPVARIWWWGLAAGVATYAVSWAYVEALLALLGEEWESESVTFVLALHIVLIAPLIEEWLCRGVLWDALRRVASPRATLVLTAFLFGMLHCLDGLTGFPNRFVAGLVFGWLRQRSGSLVPGVVAHVVHNALAVALH